jgi:hypothetical protein
MSAVVIAQHHTMLEQPTREIIHSSSHRCGLTRADGPASQPQKYVYQSFEYACFEQFVCMVEQAGGQRSRVATL